MKTVYRLGYYSSLIAGVATICYAVVQILQVAGLLGKPWDDILIYGFSLCIAAPFMLSILALHYTIPAEKRIWTHAALLFAVMYAVFVTIMYVVQLATVLPYNVTDPALTVQPHSLFWTLDALGYLHMGLASAFVLPALSFQTEQRWVKRFFLANALITPVVGLVYFYPHFSIPLLFMAALWIITAPGAMLSLAFMFRRMWKVMPEMKDMELMEGE